VVRQGGMAKEESMKSIECGVMAGMRIAMMTGRAA
jgi:hypothetical protein